MMNAAAGEIQRLRRLIHDIAVSRQDTCLVHEIAQEALGYDPDLDSHEEGGT